MQHYTISQLVRLSLIAFRQDWINAFIYIGAGSDDAWFWAEHVNRVGVVKHASEYWNSPSELGKFDEALQYLIEKFNLKETKDY